MKYILVLILIVSCSGKLGPDDVLKKYANYRLNGGFSKDAITSLLAGEMREQIEEMSEEEFENFKSLKIKGLRSLKVLKKKCQDDNCFLTYSFKYSKDLFDSQSNQEKDVEVEVKKVAKLIKIEGAWKVSTIDDLKSFIRFNKPIEPLK